MLTTKEGYSRASVWTERVVAALIGIILLSLFVCFMVLGSCGMSDESKKIINTFNSFDNKDGVRYSQCGIIILPDKQIDVYNIKFNDMRCQYIACGEEAFYAYTQEKTDKNHRNIYLLSVTYDKNEITLVDTIENIYCSKSDNGSRSFSVGNKLYIGTFNENYIAYDLDGSSYSLIPSSTVASSRDFSNYSYNILKNKNFFTGSTHYGIEIKDKTTEETRTVTMESLSSFPEGEYILSLDSDFTKTFFQQALEKDEDIYILGLIKLDGGLTSYQCVVLKYDFENDKLSYYSSMFYDWDETPTEFYINF